jgi:hypothetical protein
MYVCASSFDFDSSRAHPIPTFHFIFYVRRKADDMGTGEDSGSIEIEAAG